MNTIMSVYITITPRTNSYKLYERLKPYNVNVMDVGNKVYVYTRISIRDDAIEKVLAICNDYGDCTVDAHTIKSSG